MDTDLLNQRRSYSDNFDSQNDMIMDETEYMAELAKKFSETFEESVLKTMRKAAKEFSDRSEKEREKSERKHQDAAKKAAEKMIIWEENIRKKYRNKSEEEILKKIAEEFDDELKKRTEQELKLIERQEKNNAAWEKINEKGSKGLLNAFEVMHSDLSTLGKGGKIDTLAKGLSNFAKSLDSSINSIAKYQSSWETRLFGSGYNYRDLNTKASALSFGATSFTQQDLVSNIDKLISAGISTNVEQRAFLATVTDKVAATFEAFDSNLLKIIRIQQQDSTAARLGMEADLTNYLNSMFGNTEYLHGTRGNVSSALFNATSLMNAQDAVAMEYQAQKWLGSLYSVGFTNVQQLANTLGQLASGDVSGLTSGTGYLLNMAASRSGLNVADLLIDGIDGSEVNTLMKSMVEYLQSIANSNKVVQSQYAQLFGLSTSDIRAAMNLANQTDSIYNTGAGYTAGNANARLLERLNSMWSRTSSGELMTNALDNVKYGMASSIANNPVLYGIYAASGMLDELVGGISIPDFSVLGTGVQLNTTVADMMRVGALGTGILESMGLMMKQLATGDGLGWKSMLGDFGATGVTNIGLAKGDGFNVLMSSNDLKNRRGRNATYISNSSSGDIQGAITQDADVQRAQVLEAAQAEEGEDAVTLATVNSGVSAILTLLEEVTTGSRKFYTTDDLKVNFDSMPE